MNSWIWIVIMLVIVIILQTVIKRPPILTSTKEEPEVDEKKFRYQRKNFLTDSEKRFLLILQELAKYNMVVVPQVNLATIVQKIGEFRYQNELYRNIDFAIFDNDYNLLLLVELNDATHRQNSRRLRDLKVKDITMQAGIKLMTFYKNKPNKPEYVIGRILDELGSPLQPPQPLSE